MSQQNGTGASGTADRANPESNTDRAETSGQSSFLSLPPKDSESTNSSMTAESGTTDEDSETQSALSRRDSLESNGVGSGSKTVSAGGDDATRAARGEEDGAGAGAGGESSGHKRRLSAAAGTATDPAAMLRKACDTCTKRKRKCNGQHPCSQCIETGLRHQCVYSPRLKSGRKKKVRIDGVLYEEGGGPIPEGANGMALVSSRRLSNYTVDTQAGRFSASGAVGLAGHVENFFLATYLRDFNRIVPLTTESSVTEGMLEVLSPAVSSTGLSLPSPIPQPESRRQAKLAVFWGVVAMGSRILKAQDEATARYLSLMRAALRECFDSNDKEVVQAYLLLSTVETMRGNEEAGKRYLDHAHSMHNGNAMGPEGQLLQGRQEQEESLDLVFQIYGQPDGCVGNFGDYENGNFRRHSTSSCLSTGEPRSTLRPGVSMDGTTPANALAAPVTGPSSSASAVDQMIAQAMSPPSESQSGPLKALKYLSTACGLSSEVFDPTNKCVTVKQYLGEMDSALKGADSLFKHTDLSECITGVVMVKIWGGITVLMQSWGKPQEKEMGLAQVEEGVGYALTRPGLMTFPMWWHALHSAAIVLAHFGHNDTFMRLRATFNKNTFDGTGMPPIETYSPGAICPQLGGSCSKLAYWLQVRGTMCSAAGWKPQYMNSKLTEESENAAYAAALGHKFSSKDAKDHNPNGLAYQDMPKRISMSGNSTIVGDGPLQREQSPEVAVVRATLATGLGELEAGHPDLVGLEGLPSSEVVDLDPLGLGVEFDLSQFKDLETESDVPSSNSGPGDDSTMGEPPGSTADGFAMSNGQAVMEIEGGGGLSRELSYSISGDGMLSRQGHPSTGTIGAEYLSRQSSLDINTILQMASSDEELKQQEGVAEDIMDAALAFGDGPAKELFGVELSAL